MDDDIVRNRPKVHTTVRDWATECRMADAAEAMDGATTAGIIAVESARQPVQYEFSNGRTFRAPRA